MSDPNDDKNPVTNTAVPSPGGSIILDGERRLRLVWRLILFLFALAIVVLVLQIVLAIGYLIFLTVTNPDIFTQRESPDRFSEALTQHQLELTAIAALPMFLSALAVVAVFRKFIDRRTVKSVGLSVSRREFCWQTLIGLIVGALPMFIVAGIAYAAGGLASQGWTISTVTLAILIPGLLFAAYFEELVCRGYMLQNFVEADRTWWGIAINSILFWLFHSLNPDAWGSPWVAVNLMLAGVFLSFAYLATRNLWFPTVVHFAWNFAQGPFLGIPVSGIAIGGVVDMEIVNDSKGEPKMPDWVTGGDFGFEGSAICALVLTGFSAALYFYWQMHASRGGQDQSTS